MLRIQSKEHRCGERLPNGRICGRTFSRPWNLKRHIASQHGQGSGNAFIVIGPTPTGASQDGPVQREPPVETTEPGPSETSINCDTRPPKRRWTGRHMYHEIMPTYEIKHSRNRRQLRAVSWLAEKAKESLEGRVATSMAAWGLLSSHSGTCVLAPAEWAAADPCSLMESFTRESCPDKRTARRQTFQYLDHVTTLTRAIAWFADSGWPRRGIELDNLIECGPYQRSDGSHRCHNPLCITPEHVLLEPCRTNLDRNNCHSEALLLRREGRAVPAHCRRHSPPCLLQHAALTTYERFLVQFWVLCQSRGLPYKAAPKPPHHVFPTFEDRLPLKFGSEVQLRQECLHAPQGRGPVPKPKVACRYCRSLKSFATVTAYWAHLVYKHAGEREDERLEEVKHTAALWKEYHRKAGIRAKQGDPTESKLQQAIGGMTWEQVLEWGLRGEPANTRE